MEFHRDISPLMWLSPTGNVKVWTLSAKQFALGAHPSDPERQTLLTQTREGVIVGPPCTCPLASLALK